MERSMPANRRYNEIPNSGDRAERMSAKREVYYRTGTVDVDILVVKIGYLVPELYDLRGDWIMALTPGGVDQDLKRLDYQRIARPMFPLDPEMEDPDLSARLVPLSHQER
jgi:microcystin degradation protein MlrC